jgi:hypothetical protein
MGCRVRLGPTTLEVKGDRPRTEIASAAGTMADDQIDDLAAMDVARLDGRPKPALTRPAG